MARPRVRLVCRGGADGEEFHARFFLMLWHFTSINFMISQIIACHGSEGMLGLSRVRPTKKSHVMYVYVYLCLRPPTPYKKDAMALKVCLQKSPKIIIRLTMNIRLCLRPHPPEYSKGRI